MTSKKTKVGRREQSRLIRAKALADIDPTDPSVNPPPGSVLANQSALAHNNTYGLLPRFYIDKVVVCRQCAKEEVWPAERQKWWYEVAKQSIFADAVLCRACRSEKKQKKVQQRRIHLDGLKKKHPHN
jgi:hypothetical protein